MRILKYILPALLLASCTKGLDINEDPNNPRELEVSKLLPGAEKALGDALTLGNGNNGGLGQVLSIYTHQLSTREEPDQYGATGNEFYIGTAWPKLYAVSLLAEPVEPEGVIKNLDEIIKIATPSGNLKYAGIAKILKAYTYSVLVDVFGDVPFSEANNPDITYPKFDDDAEIYPKLLTMLDEGIADINNADADNVEVPGTDDVIYGGNIAKWTKAANTIKLKMYLQLSKIQNVSTQVSALLAGNLISATNESFLLPYGTNGATDDRNPGFGDYYATQRGNYISPWFYEILRGYNTNLFTGIKDPRIPYYIFNQTGATAASQNATEYRDSGFISIYFGSVGANRDRIQQSNMSVLGIYPVGGRYDDGAGGVVSSSSGTGAAPYRFITYADRLYIEAELIREGIITGDARAKLEAAINESFKQVDYVIAQYIKPAQTVPTLVGTTEVTDYISRIMAYYDANTAKQLEIIMTQKWISSFGSFVDQYNDYRRTGFPILFDPRNTAMAPGGMAQPPLKGDPTISGNQAAVPVLLSKNYPASLPWFQGELETNSNAPAQKEPSTSKVFWMP